MSQIMLKVGSAQKGSIRAVAGSGMISMSLALIGCQPRMLDPSKPYPSSKLPSSSWLMGTEKCCQTPGKSMNRMSSILAPFSFAKASTSLGFMLQSSLTC